MKINRLTNKNIADKIAQGIVILLIVLEKLIKVLSRLIWRFKRIEFKLLCALIGLLIVMSLTPIAQAPAQDMNGYVKVEKPLTERQQIINYIYQVFGDQADNAYKVLACENGRLNPNAQGHNTNNTVDTGIFQVNSIHGVPEAYLKDWRTNIDIAYQIYKGSGWGAWSCATYYNSLERKDTVK